MRRGEKTAGNARRAICFVVRVVKRSAGFLYVRARIGHFGKWRERKHDLRDREYEHRRPPERAGQDT